MDRSLLRGGARTLMAAALGLTAVTLGIAAGAGTSAAADPFVAGEAATRPVTIGLTDSARALARAATVARGLGLPDGTAGVTRVDDRFDHQVYDEVTTRDTGGRPLAIQRLDPQGGLLMAVGLGWRASTGRAVDADGAAAAARRAARAAGLDPAGSPDVRRSAGAGGWSVSWPRIVDGVPVPGDGVRVSLWADGAFHALSRTEHPLAGRPAVTLTPGAAAAAAAAFLDRSFAPADRVELVVAEPGLAWVAPNDAFDARRPDAPAAELRLAWVVEARATGRLAERLAAIQVWIDAGDGSILGGDVAE